MVVNTYFLHTLHLCYRDWCSWFLITTYNSNIQMGKDAKIDEQNNKTIVIASRCSESWSIKFDIIIHIYTDIYNSMQI